MKLHVATPADAEELVRLHLAVNQDLTVRYGQGPWSGGLTERGVLFSMRRATVYVAKVRKRAVATLALSTRKPWAIDTSYFSPVKRPLYLTSMAVAPDHQRQGIGRMCIKEARRFAKKWPADAIRLDAFDADAGAGEFYSKCGFREVVRRVYKINPLIYFEMLL